MATIRLARTHRRQQRTVSYFAVPTSQSTVGRYNQFLHPLWNEGYGEIGIGMDISV